jgi:NAD(P)-dependent dehydrogenase (short-subunit alcohol dehydrogenase family)
VTDPLTRWDLYDIPAQAGRTTLVTGCTVGGLGFHVALELARRGGRVVLAGRSLDKLDTARAQVSSEVPGADLETLVVDLADLDAVRRAAAPAAGLGPIHCLVNNAGVMATPQRRTVDGLDLQLATNHFGPFLLTGLLLPQLVAAGGARVVTVSSQMHRVARQAPVGDPRQHPSRRYQRWQTYAQSKLANLLFTFELDRRLRAAGLDVIATAAHPGYAGTHLVVNGRTGGLEGPVASILHGANKALAQSAAAGAQPLLMAATADVPGSSYCGPGGVGESRGEPRLVGCTSLARDPDLQSRLWDVSEKAVGLTYP